MTRERIEGKDCDCKLGHLEDGVTPCPRCKFGLIREGQAERDRYLLAGHGDPIDPYTVDRIIPARYRENDGPTLFKLFQGSPTAVAALVWIEEWTRQTWPEQKRQSVFIHGPVGTGKTTLAMYALKRFMEYGHRAQAVFWSMWNLEMGGLDYQAQSGEAADLTKVPVLLLDDLGSQDRVERGGTEVAAETSRRQDVARAVIDTRMNKAVPTIITTNLTLEQFGLVWGHRVGSRIQEDFKILEVNGVDLRTKVGVNA